MQTFLQRCGQSIVGFLSCFDRLRLRGTKRLLAHVSGFKHWLWQAGVYLTDFDKFVQDKTTTLCTAIEQAAKDSGRPLTYVPSGGANKGPLAEHVAARDGIREGLIGVWSCVEPCSSCEIHRNKETHKLELQSRFRKCLHYYHYYLHPHLGLLHTRLQTWFPFTMHICLNGHEWLARQLDQAGIAYRKLDNCFVQIADLAAAQRLADEQLRAHWPDLLDSLARWSNPLCDTLLDNPVPYYWTVDQSEWSTDILFRSAAALQTLYPRLTRHGIDAFHCEDVMRFLGYRLTPSGKIRADFNDELSSDLQRRQEGTRLKHKLDVNSLKMYDKAYDACGAVLRLEATYNSVRNLKVFRTKEGDPDGEKQWRCLRKSVADISRRADLSNKATQRYAEALATVEDKTPLQDLTDGLCRPTTWKGRRVRALQPLNPDDARLLETINRGEFMLDGFRNADLRRFLYDEATVTTTERRRRSAAVTRQIRLLRAHGLIQKVQKSHRYHVTAHGRTAISAILVARQADTTKLAKAA